MRPFQVIGIACTLEWFENDSSAEHKLYKEKLMKKKEMIANSKTDEIGALR